MISPSSTLMSVTDEEGDSENEDEDDARVEIRVMQVVLRSMPQRMSFFGKSRMLHGSPQSLLDSADIDPFATASVTITKGMNKVFSHCRSKNFIRTEHCQKIRDEAEALAQCVFCC
jgi:hypothetical protein